MQAANRRKPNAINRHLFTAVDERHISPFFHVRGNEVAGLGIIFTQKL